MLRVFRDRNGRDRPKQLLTERRHRRGDIRQHGWRIIIPLAADFLTAQQQRCPFCQRRLHLLMQFIAQIKTRHRAQVVFFLVRRTQLQGRNRIDKALGKGVRNTFFHNEAFGRRAHLSGILVAACYRRLHGKIQVGIVENDERV